jgi:alpha-L-fucosidase
MAAFTRAAIASILACTWQYAHAWSPTGLRAVLTCCGQHKWEDAFTIDHGSWGLNRNSDLSQYLSIEQIIAQVVVAVACNGNALINIGPGADGTISPIFEERLLQLGSWLSVNGDAIYASKPWRAQNDTEAASVWYTQGSAALYAIVLQWPAHNTLTLAVPKPVTSLSAHLLGFGSVAIKSQTTGVVVTLPSVPPGDSPCPWAWVVALSGVA